MNEFDFEFYTTIGGMLRDVRAKRGFTLEQVAEQLGVTPKTLQRYEIGERKIKLGVIKQLSHILSFDYDKFITEAKRRMAGEGFTVNETSSVYYIDEETRKIAQELLNDKDMKLLFDVKRSIKGQDLINYAKYLKEQYERENRL